MQTILGIPWYYYLLAGAMLGTVIGRIFKGLDFETYFLRSFLFVFVVIVVGAFLLFAMRLTTDIYGDVLGDIFFTLLYDFGSFYIANLAAVWLFRK